MSFLKRQCGSWRDRNLSEDNLKDLHLCFKDEQKSYRFERAT